MASSTLSGPTDLLARVDRLSQFFDVDRVLARNGAPNDIVAYYRKSAIAYAVFHSKHGSIHMALNPGGVFDESGYYRAPELAWNALTSGEKSGTFLELGCGNGFNLDLIAAQDPSSTFHGIDLVAQHVKRARRRTSERSNVAVSVADFQTLPFPSASVAGAYSIESFCHAPSAQAALTEIARALRPGGKFVVIDAWRTRIAGTSQLDRALKLTEKSMSVSATLTHRQWLTATRSAGFLVREVRELSSEVLPNLERFERLAERFMAYQNLAKFAGRTMRIRALENVIAGYLMAQSVREGHHRYDLIVLEKA